MAQLVIGGDGESTIAMRLVQEQEGRLGKVKVERDGDLDRPRLTFAGFEHVGYPQIRKAILSQ